RPSRGAGLLHVEADEALDVVVERRAGDAEARQVRGRDGAVVRDGVVEVIERLRRHLEGGLDRRRPEEELRDRERHRKIDERLPEGAREELFDLERALRARVRQVIRLADRAVPGREARERLEDEVDRYEADRRGASDRSSRTLRVPSTLIRIPSSRETAMS